MGQPSYLCSGTHRKQFLAVDLFCFGVGLFDLFSAIERAPFRAPDKSVFCCGLGTVVSCVLFVPGTLQFDNDSDPSLSSSE